MSYEMGNGAPIPRVFEDEFPATWSAVNVEAYLRLTKGMEAAFHGELNKIHAGVREELAEAPLPWAIIDDGGRKVAFQGVWNTVKGPDGKETRTLGVKQIDMSAIPRAGKDGES